MPRTAEGKATTSRNGFKGANLPTMRVLVNALRGEREWLGDPND